MINRFCFTFYVRTVRLNSLHRKTEPQAIAGDAIIALTSPEKTIERVKERLDEENSETAISYEKVEDLLYKE